MIVDYRSLDSYKKILNYMYSETTGPIQEKEGTVKLEGKTARQATVQYLYRPKDGSISRRNPSGAGGLRILDTIAVGASLDGYDKAFKRILQNIEHKEETIRKLPEERVSYLDQMRRSKSKVFKFLFDERGLIKYINDERYGKKFSRDWYSPKVVNESLVKRFYKFLKYFSIIQKGRDY